MKWIDKLREGATRAADKAQKTIDATRITAQVAGKRKQIRDVTRKLGVSVYEAYKRGDVSTAEADIVRFAGQIDGLEREIGNLELALQKLNGEKTCACGRVVSVHVRFCPDCGHRFETEPEMVQQALEIEGGLRCIECDAPVSVEDQLCGQCGAEQSEVPTQEMDGEQPYAEEEGQKSGRDAGQVSEKNDSDFTEGTAGSEAAETKEPSSPNTSTSEGQEPARESSQHGERPVFPDNGGGQTRSEMGG